MPRNGCRHVPYNPGTKPYNGQRAMVNVPYRMPYNAQRPYGTMPCRARAVIELIQCTCRRTRTARSPGREARPSVHSSGFVLCRPSFKVYFLRAPRKRSPVCAASPLLEHLRRACRPAASGGWRSYRFTLRRRMYHGTVIVTTYRNETANSHQARGACIGTPHSSADTPRSPPKRYLLLQPRLWCVHCPDHSDHDPLRIRTSTSLRSSTSVSSVPKRTPRFVSVGVAPAHRSGP